MRVTVQPSREGSSSFVIPGLSWSHFWGLSLSSLPHIALRDDSPEVSRPSPGDKGQEDSRKEVAKPNFQDRHARGRVGRGFGMIRSIGTVPMLAKPSCKWNMASREQPGLSAEEGVSGRSHRHKPEERETVACGELRDSLLALPVASDKCRTAQGLETLVEPLSSPLTGGPPRHVKRFLTQTCHFVISPSEKRLP